MARRPYPPKQRTLDQARAFATQVLVYRDSLDGYTAEDLARSTGLGLPEAQAMLERERLRRLPR